MQSPARLSLRLAAAPRLLVSRTTPVRTLHTTLSRYANVAPIVGTGPPPEAPIAKPSHAAPATTDGYQRVERRRRQAEMLKNAKEIRKNQKTGLKARFWNDVSVRDEDGFLKVYLDQRPLRHPTTKEIMRIPRTKPNLAAALAIEWDSMTSTQEAARQHLVPLTSLVCRALDIEADDALPEPTIRQSIVTTLLAYLDTDALLCWAPPPGPHDILNEAGESLRDVQKRTTDEIVSFLTTNTWPGIQIRPVLDGHSIVPQSQADGVREVVQGWVTGLDAWELAGLERAVLAGKSLVTAARLVAEWSEGAAAKGAAAVADRLGDAAESASEFGAEEAAKAASLEVDWQATQWGEVEDTHDVNNEDVRRQLASVILLVSGTGRP